MNPLNLTGTAKATYCSCGEAKVTKSCSRWTVYSRVTAKPATAAHLKYLKTQNTVFPVSLIFSHFSSKKLNIFWHDLKAGSSCIATEAPRAHAGMMAASGTTFLSVTTRWRAPQALNNSLWLLFELEHLLSGEMTHGSDSQIFLHCMYAGDGIAHPWEVTRC